MGKHVYIETTVVSYLVARPSRDLVVAGRQETTREWWDKRRTDFELYVSELVMAEAKAGDPAAAQRRTDLLAGMQTLEITEDARSLAKALLHEGPLPERATDDALHLAVAAVHGMDFLLTWNCSHLANAEWVEEIGQLLLDRGYRSPVVCTPETLMGEMER